MRKLVLDIDSLKVDSFATAGTDTDGSGSVGAHQQNPNPSRDWACGNSAGTDYFGCGPSGPCWCKTYGFTCLYQSCMYTECPAQTNIGQGGCAGGGGGEETGYCGDTTECSQAGATYCENYTADTGGFPIGV